MKPQPTAHPVSIAAGLMLSLLPALSRAADAGWRTVTREFIEPAPAVAEVHASTLAEAADGTVVAAWFGGTKEGNPDVSIYVSRLEDGRWTAARKVAAGAGEDGGEVAACDPVLHRGRDGELFLFFSVGPSPPGRWAEMMVSRDNGVSWGGRRRLPGEMKGPSRNRPLHAAGGGMIIPSDREGKGGIREIWMETGDERFRSWSSTRVADPGNLQASQPALVPYRHGGILALCRTAAGQIARTTSEDSGVSWGPLEPTGMPMIDSALDAIALREGGYLLAYNPGKAPENPGDTDPREPRCPLVVSFSADAGVWETIATLESRPTRWGYAYPSLLQTIDGRVHVTYTWNRGRIRHVVLERATP